MDTNIFNLPHPFVSALNFDDYDAGGADITATGAILPPRIRQLEIRHKDEITEDVSDKVWRMLGSIGHKILERADTDNHLSEERLFAKVNGWTVSGKADLLGPDMTLCDYKFTSVWAVKDAKPEFEQQLNIYAWLYRENGFEVKRARIIAVLRDWSKLRAEREPEYPQVGVVVREVPIWKPENQRAFVSSRVLIHQLAMNKSDEALPLCTDEERWHKSDTWAVKKKGNKRATKVYQSEFDATTDILERFEEGRKFEIEHRPGVDVRCASYCRVAPFCSQYAAILDRQVNKQVMDAAQILLGKDSEP